VIPTADGILSTLTDNVALDTNFQAALLSNGVSGNITITSISAVELDATPAPDQSPSGPSNAPLSLEFILVIAILVPIAFFTIVGTLYFCCSARQPVMIYGDGSEPLSMSIVRTKTLEEFDSL
jgi:hypothetical protein